MEKSLNRRNKGANQQDNEGANKEFAYSQSKDSGGSNILFWGTIVLTQIVGLLCIGLAIYWMQLYGGFAWTSDFNKQFAWHPVLMVVGFMFCYGNAVIAFRVFSFLPKWLRQGIHAFLCLCTLILTTIAVIAVLENHRRATPPKADFYSLHSWVGIGTYGFFLTQYVSTAIAFYVPGFPSKLRVMMMPFHKFFGLAFFLIAAATVHTGLTERLLWTENYTSGRYLEEGAVGNLLGLCIIIFVILIVFIKTNSAFKRKSSAKKVT